MKKPTVAERFSDNGQHSHWELIDEFGGVIWSEIKPELTSEQVYEKMGNLTHAFSLLASEVDSVYQEVQKLVQRREE